jgi:hypothetical protein
MEGYFIRVGDKIICGKHPGTFTIVGDHPNYISFNTQPIAGTLYSRSTCPCKACLISSLTSATHLAAQTQTTRNTVIGSTALGEPLATYPDGTMGALFGSSEHKK